MALNAIIWIAQGEVPQDGVQSPDISEEQLNKNIGGVPKERIKRIPDEEILKMAPMLRPKDPANYNQRAHYDLVKEIKAAAENKFSDGLMGKTPVRGCRQERAGPGTLLWERCRFAQGNPSEGSLR